MIPEEIEIRSALAAGPTRGPWVHRAYESGIRNVEFPEGGLKAHVDQVFSPDLMSVCHESSVQADLFINVDPRPEDRKLSAQPQRTKNARFIAAANPSAIAALLIELDTLRKNQK